MKLVSIVKLESLGGEQHQESTKTIIAEFLQVMTPPDKSRHSHLGAKIEIEVAGNSSSRPFDFGKTYKLTIEEL